MITERTVGRALNNERSGYGGIDDAGVALRGAEVTVPGTDPAGGPVTPGDEQRAGGPPAENPTSRQAVHDWIARRVASDEQMRWAGAARKARDHAHEES